MQRLRRTKHQITDLRDVLERVTSQFRPMTVRQVSYRMVSMGQIEKTEAEYKGTVCRLLADMRRDGQIPYYWIADNTRWQRRPRTFSSLVQALEHTSATYRRSIWDDQTAYVAIWLEKDALSGVLLDVTMRWDVPLMVTRGFSSLSFLYGAAETIAQAGKPAYLYYFGDRDPSGVAIDRKVEQELRALAPTAEIHFERVAVTPEQVVTLGLPTRPTKTSDSRSRTFEGDSVELDAIDPDTLRQMVEDCIVRHVDQEARRRVALVERTERMTLVELARTWAAGNAR
jgi:hypothetical protein